MGITIDAVIHADDDLTKWIDRRLDMTMGRQGAPTHPPQKATSDSGRAARHAPAPLPSPLSNPMGDIASKVGRGIVLGFQAWSNASFGMMGAKS